MGLDARIFAAVNDKDTIEWSSGIRFFSSSYPRGHWPTIRFYITTLQERFPEYPVFYMSDEQDYFNRDENYLCTPERLSQLDADWAEWDASGQTYPGLIYAAILDVRERQSRDVQEKP